MFATARHGLHDPDAVPDLQRHQRTFHERSTLVGLFANAWLWAAIAGSLALQLLVVYTPVLQRAFGTVPLTLPDWLLCVAVASSVLWIRELSKAVARYNRRLAAPPRRVT